MGLMLLASFFFSCGTLFVVLLQNHLSVSQILFFRNLVALVLIVPYFLKNREEIRTGHLRLHAARGFLANMNVFLFYLSFRYLNFVDSTILNATYTVFIPFVSFIWLKEPLRSRIWWAIGFGLLGIVLIVHPLWDIYNLGLLIALTSSITSSISFTAVRSLNLRNEPPMRSYFYFYLIGAAITFPFAIGGWIFPTRTEWIYLLCLGFSMAANQVLLTKAYQRGPAALIAPVSYSAIIFSAILSWAIFSQTLSFDSILGSLLIGVGGFLTMLKKEREPIKP